MSDRFDLYFRAHTIPVEKQEEEHGTDSRVSTPDHVLIFHCLTTRDEKQYLLLGAYICARLLDGKYVIEEIGLFCRDGHPEELRLLQRFAKGSIFEVGTVEDFRRKIFLKYLKAGALIVAYDAPAQISRIAVRWNKSLKKRRAVSFYFREFRDKRTGKVRPSGYEPGLSIESLDASKAIYRLIKYMSQGTDADREEEQPASNVHILDLKTLTAALTGEALTLVSACEMFEAPASRSRKSWPRVTKPAIEHLLRNVTAELELLNRLNDQFYRHPVGLAPERCYSSATLARAYFSAMGIQPPEKKFDIPNKSQAIAMQAFFAGRSETTIRRTPVAITYVDFHSQFPAVSSLLDCSEILRSEWLEFPDFTAGARDLIESVTPEDCLRPELWKQLRWYALVEPNEDVVPVRAKFGRHENSDPTLAWNFLTSKQPIWITGPDAVATKLLTGNPIKILQAFKVVPHGVQPGLAPIKLLSELDVDPLRDDLAVKFSELRAGLTGKDRKLAGGLKVAANAAAFGMLCQMNVKDLDSPSPLQIFSGEAEYRSPKAKLWEQPAEFYCPVIASLVTGGSHLLCAMLERTVRDTGGQIAAMDTDSAMIVATKDGGLIPCAGGPHRLEKFQRSGHDAIRALSWAEVDHIREKFEALNPWRDTLGVPFLKLEKENFAPDGERCQLYAYCISAKLYCLFNLDENTLVIRKPSGHGLGFLNAPYSVADWQRRKGRKWKENLPPWIFEAWHFILSRELDLPHQRPRWFKQPAVMAVPVTTPQILERLGYFKDVLRPFTVVMVPFPEKEENVLWTGYFVIPHAEKLHDLHGRPMVNIVSGATFYIYDKQAAISTKSLGWLSLRTIEDEINRILTRVESKFCTPNGSACLSKTVGLLVRRHIVAGEFHYIGKEASTRWAGGVDLSMMAQAGALDPMDETFREYERIVDPNYLDEIRAAAKQFSTKLLSRKSSVAECAIRNFKNGKNTIKPRTLRKLTRAIHDLQNE
jgi:hypothetical protein